MILLIDNFDSFSHMLADYVLRTGVEVRIVRNDIKLDAAIAVKPGGIVISPGPGTPRDSGNLMDILAYFHDKVPILGVCLGHQAIGEFFGAKLARSLRPMHGKVSKVRQICSHPITEILPQSFSVTRYHSLVLKDIQEPLFVLMESEDGEIMAVAHRHLPIMGIQYHPEAHLTEHGDTLILSWLGHYGLISEESSYEVVKI